MIGSTNRGASAKSGYAPQNIERVMEDNQSSMLPQKSHDLMPLGLLFKKNGSEMKALENFQESDVLLEST